MNKILFTVLAIFVFTEASFAAMSGGSSSSSGSSSSTGYSASSSDDSGPYSPTSRFKDINKLIKEVAETDFNDDGTINCADYEAEQMMIDENNKLNEEG